VIPLVLVAASGLAREVLSLVQAEGTHQVVGVVDDDVTLHGTTIDGAPVLGGLDVLHHHPHAQLLVCVGRGSSRESLVDRLSSLGVPVGRYATVIAADVAVPRGCTIGPGSILLSGVVLTTAVSVGRHAVAMPHVTLTHDCVVDDFATLCAGVTLGGGVHVGRGAYLGMNSSIREHVRVGDGATLGMGSVLLSDLPAGDTWAGVPARSLIHQATTHGGGST
jgi:sugar O-acyltransferase (sialic acid O-acetyltransferase NeuD family)